LCQKFDSSYAVMVPRYNKEGCSLLTNVIILTAEGDDGWCLNLLQHAVDGPRFRYYNVTQTIFA